MSEYLVQDLPISYPSVDTLTSVFSIQYKSSVRRFINNPHSALVKTHRYSWLIREVKVTQHFVIGACHTCSIQYNSKKSIGTYL